MKLTKDVNLAQLDSELGKPGLSLTGDELQAHGNITEAQLKAAVDAHVPDPNFGRTQLDIDIDDFLAKSNPTSADLIKAAKAMARKMRGRK